MSSCFLTILRSSQCIPVFLIFNIWFVKTRWWKEGLLLNSGELLYCVISHNFAQLTFKKYVGIYIEKQPKCQRHVLPTKCRENFSWILHKYKWGSLFLSKLTAYVPANLKYIQKKPLLQILFLKLQGFLRFLEISGGQLLVKYLLL